MKFYQQATFWYSRGMILLLYLPLFNFTFFSIAVTNIGFANLSFLSGLALYMWTSSAVSLFFAWLSEQFITLDEDSIKTFILKYSFCAILAWYCSFILLQWLDLMRPPSVVQAKMPVLPLMIVLMEVFLFAALKYIFKQQQQQVILRANYKEAQFRALKAQLNPHMLFNSLNLISSEIEHNPKNASLLVDELAELLRKVLRSSNNLVLPLYQEIELTKHYLVIQKMRFEHRLEYCLDIEEDCKQIKIPALILQPFVENCILHGFASKKETGKIKIKITKNQQILIIVIQDNGVGFVPSLLKKGHGISIVKDTLMLIYGHEYSLKIDSIIQQGTKVVIKIPIYLNNPTYQLKEEYAV